jgi:hypothetical protein
MAGIPSKFHPTLKSLINPWDEVEDFRRRLINAEQGLQPWFFDEQGDPKGNEQQQVRLCLRSCFQSQETPEEEDQLPVKAPN